MLFRRFHLFTASPHYRLLFFLFPFLLNFHPPPFHLLQLSFHANFSPFPFTQVTRIFEEWPKLPSPPLGGRILRFKSLESRLKTTPTSLQLSIRDSFLNSPARVVRQSPYEMETLLSSNIQRDVRPFCSKENTCALSELRGLIEALRELFINHEDFSLLVTTVSSKSVHR